MAARSFTQFAHSLEKKRVALYAHVTFGSSGAPTLSAIKSKGIASVTRSGQGVFVFALQDAYQRLIFADARFIVSSGVPAAPIVGVVTDGSATKSVTLKTSVTVATGATDPASGEVGLFKFELSDSSI